MKIGKISSINPKNNLKKDKKLLQHQCYSLLILSAKIKEKYKNNLDILQMALENLLMEIH